jgi:hypothetical protein
MINLGSMMSIVLTPILRGKYILQLKIIVFKSKAPMMLLKSEIFTEQMILYFDKNSDLTTDISFTKSRPDLI